MKRRLTTRGLKRKLDRLFSLMIRTRDAEKLCVSCGEWKNDKEAGHFIDRNRLSTRYHPWNVNGECVHCNHADDGHLVGYAKSINERYGDGSLETLARLARMRWKPLPDQLERLILACDNPADYEEEWFNVQREFEK